jgi:hypothetical protein
MDIHCLRTHRWRSTMIMYRWKKKIQKENKIKKKKKRREWDEGDLEVVELVELEEEEIDGVVDGGGDLDERLHLVARNFCGDHQPPAVPQVHQPVALARRVSTIHSFDLREKER